jgi:diaminohydroxyphosphoribosylaminopyrimidine deaminase / 5-amino-6-(5-phosphoribosylamino)uracil reductase
MNIDELYILRCLELAKNGRNNVAPNPLVGCVIVCDNKIIGEGYHKKFGESHAEVNAINSVKDKTLLKKSRLYVNLEPCAHYGKTPPCADLIIENKIPEVIIGCIDSFSEVSGKGIKKLKKAGCNVKIGVLEKESKELNKQFFTFYEKKRPYIILKWAQSLDGFIDALREDNTAANPTWITNEKLRMLIHKWRTEEQAIMVGTNTALLDNPSLNAREWFGKSPIRVVIDRELIIPLTYNIFNQQIKTIVFTEKIRESKENILYITVNFSESIIEQILFYLYEAKIQSLIVEGGSILLNSFIDKNIWDEARVFIGNKLFCEGVKAPNINEKLVSNNLIYKDHLLFYNQNQ